jgi:hypothetical protein
LKTPSPFFLITERQLNMIEEKPIIQADALLELIQRSIRFTNCHFTAVGKMAVSFSALEFVLSEFTAYLINKDDPFSAQLAFKNLSSARLIEVSRVLFYHREQRSEFRVRYDTILDSIDQARSTRNEVVHLMWDSDPITEQVFLEKLHITKQRSPEIVVKPFSIDQLNDLADISHSAYGALIMFIRDWKNQLPPNDQGNAGT